MRGVCLDRAATSYSEPPNLFLEFPIHVELPRRCGFAGHDDLERRLLARGGLEGPLLPALRGDSLVQHHLGAELDREIDRDGRRAIRQAEAEEQAVLPP